jgi:hypothetical protein
MPSTNYLGNILLDFILGAVSYSPPATVYIGLFTATPTPSTAGTEVAGGSYGRVAITNDTTEFPVAVSKSKSNANSVTFAAATAGWGTVVAIGVFDDLTAGNLMLFASLSTPRLVNTGDAPNFAIGQLVFNAV